MSLISLDLPTGNIGDLTVPTSTAQYKLGRVVTFQDPDTQTVKKFKYVYASVALTKNAPYAVTNTPTSGKEVQAATPITLAGAVTEVCFPQVAFTSGYYGFVQIEGNGNAVITASATAVAGCQYSVTNGNATLTGTTGIVQTINTCAYLVTTTTGSTGAMYFPGNRVEVTS